MLSKSIAVNPKRAAGQSILIQIIMQFKDKVVLITGAASGIGKGAAKRFAQLGAKVLISDIQEAAGNAVVQEIESDGGTAFFQTTDVSNFEAVQALVKTCLTKYGALDIAINNAGIGGERAPSHSFSHRAWDKVIAINQTGVFYCMQEELKAMLPQQKGCIINVSSIAGLKGFPLALGYAASKHAVIGMTKTAALEYATAGIRVNAICPVFIDTPMVSDFVALEEGLSDRLKKGIPMKRFGEVAEVVDALCWLANEHASFITGLCLPIDGGTMA